MERLAIEDFWSQYVTHYWARLIERVRVRASRRDDRNPRVKVSFMEAFYGTLMLACVGTYTKSYRQPVAPSFF